MFYYVYVLYCHRKAKLYYGFTNDLKRRMSEHKRNKVPYSFTRHENVELIYYEAHRSKEDALKREVFLKSGWGRTHIRKTLSNYLSRFNSTSR